MRRPAGLAMDLTPLRESRDFRLLYAGFLGMLIGTLMTSVAVAVQVYDLTGSSLDVGLVSLARALPLVVGLLAGGVLADRLDRRRLMLATRLPLVPVAALLALNALAPDPRIWLIYLATALTGLFAGLGGPAMLAAIPALVGTHRLAAAGALTAASTQLAAVLGPALGGALIAGPGVAACFLVDAAGFLLFSAFLLFVRPLPPQRDAAPGPPPAPAPTTDSPEGAGAGAGAGGAGGAGGAEGAGAGAGAGGAGGAGGAEGAGAGHSGGAVGAAGPGGSEASAANSVGAAGALRQAFLSVVDGVRFVRGHRLIVGLLLIDAAAMVFTMPQALYPVLADTQFGGGPGIVGLLYAAPALGALVGAATSGWTGRAGGHALVGAVLLWGLSLTGFGLTSFLPAALALLALAGFGDLISETLRSALLQHGTPDQLRGRVSSLWMVQATVSPALGNAGLGFFAELAGARTAVVVGGLFCVVATLGVAAAFPSLRYARLDRAPAVAPAARPGSRAPR